MLEQCSISQMGKSGIPENIDDGEIEGKVTVFPSLSRRKDSDKIRRVRSKLKTTDLIINKFEKKENKHEIYFDNKKISSEHSVKLLGIGIDNQLYLTIMY